MEDDWALIVGINSYPMAGVDPLEGAVHDAKEFCRCVIDPQGGDVPNNHAELLTSPHPAAPGLPRPVFSEIRQFFENLIYDLQNTNGRRLYLYLSGHGISPSGQESVRNAALLMANARAPNFWDSFAGNVWAEGARSAALFREVVLIMDCCRDVQNNATIIPHMFGNPVDDSRDCRLIEIYATGWASKARELPFPPTNQKQGVFTHSLLEVLRSGQVNGTLLKASVIEHLSCTLKDVKKAQIPQLSRDEDLASVVFNEQSDPPSTSVTIQGHPASSPAIEFWQEGANRSLPVTLDDWTYDGSVWRGTLTPGQYDLRLPGGGGYRLKVLAGVQKEVRL
jgi:hypothetical protein